MPVLGRLQTSGHVDGLAVVDTGGGKRQRPEARATIAADVAPPLRWLRGHLELQGRIGGPFEGGPGAGVYDFERTFQNLSPAFEVREGWIEARGRAAELRVGVQQFAWGRLDGTPPTDALNPRDFHDPILWDTEERKIGVPAVAATFRLPDVPAANVRTPRLTLVWVPWAVPPRLAELEERWFPPATEGGSRFALPATIHGVPLPVRSIGVRYRTVNDPPPHTFERGGIGGRLAGSAGPVDWDVYHYSGPTTGPDVDLDTVLVSASQGGQARLRAQVGFRQVDDTVHMSGGDLAVPVGDFTVRAEVAGTLGDPQLRDVRDITSPAAFRRLPIRRILNDLARRGRARVALGPLFADVDSLQWGIGADTVWSGFVPLLQVSQLVTTNHAPQLLIDDPETRVIASVRRTAWNDRLEMEARFYVAAGHGDWFALPRVGWRIRDNLRVRVGYLAVGGPANSLVGQFGRNDEVVFDARWSF